MSRLRARERAQAMHLDEARLRDRGQQDVGGRVEALDVTDLQHAPRARQPAPIRSSASSRVVVMGFSTSTSRPASRAWRLSRWWSTVGTATETASTSASRASSARKDPSPVALGHPAARDRRRRRRRRRGSPRRGSRRRARGAARALPRRSLRAAPIAAPGSDRSRVARGSRDSAPPGSIPTTVTPAASARARKSSLSRSRALPDVQCEHPRAGLLHGLERPRPHDGHVEAHVLARLRHLDHGRARPGQPPRAPDRLVRAFHGLERHRGAILHHHGLSEVHPREGREPRGGRTRCPSLLAGRPRRVIAPAAAIWSSSERRGRQERDALALEGVGHRPDQAVRVLEREAGQERRAASGRGRCPRRSGGASPVRP